MNTHTPIESNTDIVEALQSTGMLIRLSTTSFGTQATDRIKSREVTEDAEASDDAARVVINKLPGAAKAYHKRLLTHLSAARDVINEHTTPWDEAGWRLLMTARFDQMIRRVMLIKQQFDAELQSLSANADEVIEQARVALGRLGDDVRTPTRDEMVGAYKMKWDVMPIPDGAQFKGLPDNTKAALARLVDAKVAKAFENGVLSVVERMRPLAERMLERLEAYDAREARLASGGEGGRDGTFRDTLVYNITPVSELIEAMAKINSDPRLVELSHRVKELLVHSPKELREQASARDHAKNEAKKILAVFDSWNMGAAA